VKRIKKGSLALDRYKEVADEEAEALEMLRDKEHLHLIRAIGYYSLGDKRYIISPWAGLGNLREFWQEEKTNPTRRILDHDFLHWMFVQLCGLTNAVKILHSDPGTDDSWRHGDLKPENILCFESIGTLPAEKYSPCILVIADVGLTRHHTIATQERKNETRTKSGTFMYEPPETSLDESQKKGRSRRYDIWSMGCIYLEFIIWLLYGFDKLENFNSTLASGDNKGFYEMDSSKTPKLHRVVETWIKHIKADQRCPTNCALRLLLDLVVTRLLNTDLGITPTSKRSQTLLLYQAATAEQEDDDTSGNPAVLLRAPTALNKVDNSAESSIKGRASADEADDALKDIYRRATATDGTKLQWMDFTKPAEQGPRPSQYGDNLSESDAKRPNSSASQDREVCK
jgi:serine/threonine protein kinase